MTARADRPTKLLLDLWAQGDQAALDELYPRLAAELKQLARGYLRRERPGHSLETIGLINEAYLRLVGSAEVGWQGRAHFLGIAARLMRQILVDHARHVAAGKRGGEQERVTLAESVAAGGRRGLDPEELVDLHRAIEKLHALDPPQARIVELRYFGGLTVEEAAEVTGVSAATVKREWTAAKAWLRRELGRGREA